jgi:hypothetical protein
MRIELDGDILFITDEVDDIEDVDDNITLIKNEELDFGNSSLREKRNKKGKPEYKYDCIFKLVNCIRNEYKKMDKEQQAFIQTVIWSRIDHSVELNIKFPQCCECRILISTTPRFDVVKLYFCVLINHKKPNAKFRRHRL